MEPNKKVRLSLRLLEFEIVMCSILLAIAVFNLFWRDYAGMSQFEVSISQAVFTVMMLALDLPLGRLADKFSRKWANLLGDLIAGVGFLLYASVESLPGVILAELILGIGIAASSGADGPLYEEYCEKLGLDYEERSARLHRITLVAMGAGFLLGGYIGSISPRLAVGLSAVPPLLGCIAMLFCDEDKRPRTHSTDHSIMEFLKTMRQDQKLTSTIMARTVINASTHTLVWITTPMLAVAGVPLWLVGAGWAVNAAGGVVGAHVASKRGVALSTEEVFKIPLILVVVCCTALGAYPSIVTALGFFILGTVRGWQTALMPARVQKLAPREVKTSVNSASSTLSRLTYIPIVMMIGWAGGYSPRYALLLNALIFACLGALVLPKLRKYT